MLALPATCTGPIHIPGGASDAEDGERPAVGEGSEEGLQPCSAANATADAGDSSSQEVPGAIDAARASIKPGGITRPGGSIDCGASASFSAETTRGEGEGLFGSGPMGTLSGCGSEDNGEIAPFALPTARRSLAGAFAPGARGREFTASSLAVTLEGVIQG